MRNPKFLHILCRKGPQNALVLVSASYKHGAEEIKQQEAYDKTILSVFSLMCHFVGLNDAAALVFVLKLCKHFLR